MAIFIKELIEDKKINLLEGLALEILLYFSIYLKLDSYKKGLGIELAKTRYNFAEK